MTHPPGQPAEARADEPPYAVWRSNSPEAPAGAALAIVEVSGDAERALVALGVPSLPVTGAGLRTIHGPNGSVIDELVIARPDPTTLLLFPHGGRAVIRALTHRLTALGVRPAADTNIPPHRPEADDELEARALDLLDRARSPAVIDLLLDQPRRWREHRAGRLPIIPPDHARALARLIDPPLIVAIGPPNVGKSSLLNALAREQLAVVADLPGTTRDPVGVHLDLAGLVVRYADTPGIQSANDHMSSGDATLLQIERDAERAAVSLARSADLILSCGDPISGFLPEPTLRSIFGRDVRPPTLRLLLRSDLADSTPDQIPHDAAVSLLPSPAPDRSIDTTTLPDLAQRIRDHLLPPQALRDPGAWPFWDLPANTALAQG